LQTANFNGPGQVVISGHKEAVVRGVVLAKERGARRSVILPVSAPFHCRLMKRAAKKMADVLAKSNMESPAIPVVSNLEAKVLPGQPDRIKDSLVRQVTSPVKWEQSIRYMAEQGVDTFVEIGSGRVLTNLVKRISPQCNRFSIGDIDGLNKYIERITAGC